MESAFKCLAEGMKIISSMQLEPEKVSLVMGVMQQTYEKAEECLATNYYGCKRVTEALIPLLLLSNSARIVNVSSEMGKLKVTEPPFIQSRDVDTVNCKNSVSM